MSIRHEPYTRPDPSDCVISGGVLLEGDEDWLSTEDIVDLRHRRGA